MHVGIWVGVGVGFAVLGGVGMLLLVETVVPD